MDRLTPFVIFCIIIFMRSAQCVPDESAQPKTCTNTCKDRNENEFEFFKQQCYCDEFCHVYDDCCQDADPVPPTTSSSQLPPAFANDTFTCNSSMMYNGNKDTKQGIYIVFKCPAEFTNEKIRNLCEDSSETSPFLNVPVNAIRTNVLYRNFFCAVCNEPNNVQNKTDVWFWKLNQTCNEEKGIPRNNSEDVIKVFNTKSVSCRNTYQGPEDRYRQCYIYSKECPSSWADTVVNELCQNHTDIVHHGERLTTVFKNEYCALCNGVNSTLCYDPLGDNGSDAMANVAPYSLLLDFNRELVNYEESGLSSKHLQYQQLPCSNEEIYDPWAEICRKVIYQSQVKAQANHKEPDCDSYVLYHQHEYHTLPNQSVIVHDSSILYKSNEYMAHESGIQVCKHVMENQNDTVLKNTTSEGIWDVHDTVGGIITGVGLIISLIFLSFCIFAHFVFPELRNIPGKCVLGLSFSLFVGQILFLTTMKLENYGACYVFAMMMHYAFLASFCWMNCLSFDICRAFSRMITGKGNELKQYIRYSLYAWGVPAICIGIAIILDFAPGVNEEYRPHYAEPLCWINKGKALLVLFAVPLALILISNIAMFSYTVWNICRAKRDARQIRRTTNSRSDRVLDFFLYVKLSTIMGLTWIFGFMAAATDSQVLWYFFIIFNSLQGVLLFVAFVITKRVKKLTMERSSSFKSSSFFKSFKSSSVKSSVVDSSGVYKSTLKTQSSEGNISAKSDSSH